MGNGREGLLAGLFLTILGAVLAFPSLWDAWRHDLYATGGFIAFLLWLSALGIATYRLRHSAVQSNTLWIILSALLCAAGSITSLRVAHHLALACALCGVAVPNKHGWLAAVAALSWLPASGWFISRFSAGGMAGWERPAVSLAAAIALLICLQRKSNNQPDENQS